MRAGTVIRGGLVAVAVWMGCPAWAKEPTKTPGDLLVEKARAAEEADPVAAAGFYGQAIFWSQRARDLLGEAAAVDALEDLVDRVEARPAPAPTEEGAAAPPDARAVLGAAMKALDPRRNGACASAHAIATALLREAVASGDAVQVAEAAAVLRAYGPTPKAGAAAPVLARWAEGIAAARAGDDAKAAPALQAAYEACVGNGWTQLALDAATELLALHLRTPDEAAATDLVTSAVALLTPELDPEVGRAWARAVRHRAKGAPEAVLAPFEKVANGLEGATTAGAEGGRGGDAAEEGGTPVGRAWKRLGADKPFVLVTRAGDEFHLGVPFDETSQDTLPRPSAPRHWDAGGVTLALTNGAVALRLVDLVGGRGQPGERSRASRVRAYYLLADGETWGVSSRGAVAVVLAR